MSQGDVVNNVQTGGGSVGAGGAVQARTIIGLGVAPGGTVNNLYHLSSSQAIRSTFDPGKGGGVGPLGEYGAKILQHYQGGDVYLCPVLPSSAGGVSAAVTHVGNAAGTITPTVAPHVAIMVKCMTGGSLGTAAFQFSLDGGTTYGPTVTSTVTSFTYMVPGTFCTITFPAATYVATKTATIGVDGTVTLGAAWVGSITQASSPLDSYNVLCSVVKGGALGVVTLSVSLDGGVSSLPTLPVPTAGVVVIPGTGLVLTCASSFTAGDTYSFLACPPGFSTSDITAAMNAIMASTAAPIVALCHVVGLPASAAGAISLASVMNTACATAASTYSKQYQAMVECPSSAAGDAIMSGSNAIVDSADTDTVIRAARMGSDFKACSVCVATQEQASPLNGYALRRPMGWGLAARYVEADPVSDVSEKGRGPLDFYLPGGVLHRDEFTASVSLYDAQLNALKTYPSSNGAFLTIESGGVGWRNMTTDASYQDAGAVRVLLFFLSAITNAGQKYLGSRQQTNADGTIAEAARQPISSDLDGVAKRTVGLLAGGQFSKRQASAASAAALSSSQLANSPKRLDIQYTLSPLGFVSAVQNNVFFSGVIAAQ